MKQSTRKPKPRAAKRPAPAQKSIESYPPIDLAHFAVERMAQRHRDSKDEVEKKALEANMEILHGLVGHELKQMGHQDPGVSFLTLEDDAVRRVEILEERGMKATEEDFRVSAIHDLAQILYAVVKALARLALWGDLQAARYLACCSPSVTMEREILAAGGDVAAAWKEAKAGYGKYRRALPKKPLGVWGKQIWLMYENLRLTMMYDVETSDFVYEEVSTPEKALAAYLRKAGLPQGAVKLAPDVFDFSREDFVTRMAIPALKAIQRKDKPLWNQIVADKYRDEKGANKNYHWPAIQSALLSVIGSR